ncbi:FAD-dependent oxidoreductase [Rhodoferax sp.]|uniref:FAD-dependent oxidoreductase n=1 Tax=Rhodoferax sp. TaxID=50421 RepID=UPI001ECFB750|nr:FAD-dependent oxidoreductase [Rhodoferax sp.]MBT9506916.1 FAD-dependent oxidoreductase [Rhodoferax sp.]
MNFSFTELPHRVPVLIAGGGPVGLTLAALLSRHGISSLVIEADEGYCSGSRAICMSRRSQEILGWVGADKPLVEKGLSWVGGRSYYRNDEVLHFQMPSEPTQRFAPMVNIQQFYVEEFAHQAAMQGGDLTQVSWSSRVETVVPQLHGVQVQVQTPQGTRSVHADWVVACDGGRSTVREQLGLQLQGTQYDGKYVIVDIVQKTSRPTERLAWFDPPSNPGSTILMHRQPDDVWRIDYQIRDDEDPLEAVKPENVLPRVQSHLSMIGENEPWEPLWISIYNAKCLTLPSYRQGRVLFAGDAAHLVPIFGVRGLNSGLDDAGNLAWKLARVIEGSSPDRLLDSYSAERVHATQENIAYGAKSTEFMAPPNFAFKLMREATLRLALSDDKVRPLINPRQSTPINYVGSPLNEPEAGVWTNAMATPGAPAPEALLSGRQGPRHLSSYFGTDFVALVFSDGAMPHVGKTLVEQGVAVLEIEPDADPQGQAWLRYGLPDTGASGLVLVRPDGYVMGRWRGLDPAPLLTCLKSKGVWA